MYYKDDFYKEFRTEKELCEYLEEMAKRLGMDIHDSIIYRTRDLQLRHNSSFRCS